MAGFWARRRRGAPELEAHDAGLATRAGSALVAADERLRAAAEELGFAEAALDAEDLAGFREVCVAARRQLGDAFRLQRLNHDPLRGTAADVHARTERIVELCEEVQRALDDELAALGERMSRAHRAPDRITGVRADVARLRARLPHARETLDRLAARYASEALAAPTADAAEAERLLGFAEHGAGVAERRLMDGRRDEAEVALDASVRSVHRAAALLDGVERFEVEALRAEATLSELVETARRSLTIALGQPHTARVADAIAEVRASLAAIPAVGVDTDPVAHLARLCDALARLDAALAAGRGWAPSTRPGPGPEPGPRPHAEGYVASQSAARHPPDRGAPKPAPVAPVTQVRHALADVDRRLVSARDAVAGHPGRVGAEAMARLAESERIRIDLAHCLGDLGTGLGSVSATIVATDPDLGARVIALALRAASLASESLSLARRDLGVVRVTASVR
ncbi:hypothetical protein GCM10009819_20430 [Agromyces tropicus]|uniref:DUF222 domain-containing protein n=1 Tax=Agromyces tropicus TaxID=555371 RepID=A0ABN2UGM3_9MICO